MNRDELKKVPRDLIKRFVAEMEKSFVLLEHHVVAKEMFPYLQELNEGGECWSCKCQAVGHFYEECVARTHGRIDHLYGPKKEAKNE